MNVKRRNPPRKSSRALQPVNTNSIKSNKRTKLKSSVSEAIFADDIGNRTNENFNLVSRNEKISPNVSVEEKITATEHGITSIVEPVTTLTTEHPALSIEQATEEKNEAVFASKHPSKNLPTAVQFLMLKDCMHKSEYLERTLLPDYTNFGKEVFGILQREGKAIPLETIRKDNHICQTAQAAYSTGQTRITIPTIPREDNNLKQNYSKVGVYLILAPDADGNTVAVKAGVNGDGRREGDYVLDSQKYIYVEVVSFHDASDEAEVELVQAYTQFLQHMVKKDGVPSDLRLYHQLALDGGMSCSLLRKPIMCAVESYVASEFGIAHHLKNNPHELIVGTEAFVREHKKVHDDVIAKMICDINEATGECKKNMVAANTTWKPDEKCLSNEGKNFRSAHVDMMKFTLDKTPFDKENVVDALPNPPRTKLVEDDPYDINYSPSETQEGLEVISRAQKVVADTEGGIGITYFNSVVTKHTQYDNLVDFLIECHQWAVWRVYSSSNGAKVYILHKSGSVYLVLNSSCRALNPNFSDKMQEDILSFIEIVRNALGGLDWKDRVNKTETNHGKGSLVVLLSQRLRLTSVGGYYRSKLLHYFYVPDDVRPMYLYEYNNLQKTERVTTNPKSCEMQIYYKDKKVLSISIPSKNLRKDIEACLTERNLKANLNKIARSEEEFKCIMTTLIPILQSIYFAKNNPAKRGILEIVFHHLYNQFRDSEDGFKKDVHWESTEIELYIKGFNHRYGNSLEECVQTGKPFDHAAMRAWIPTRGEDSCKTFKKNIMKKVKVKNGFTFEMYLKELQDRLRIVKKWEEYSGHYLIDKTARFKDFKTNKRVVQMFNKDVAIYNDKSRRKQFIKDFVSDLERMNIRVYKYDGSDVSFQLVANPIAFFTERFKDWSKCLKN